jgi:hypothetical protein
VSRFFAPFSILSTPTANNSSLILLLPFACILDHLMSLTTLTSSLHCYLSSPRLRMAAFFHALVHPTNSSRKNSNKTPVKPIYVDILNSSLTLVADRKYEIHCVTSGSRPDAIITWLKGKKSLKRIRDYSKNNQTTSILNFVPSIEDNGKMLTCHAENPNVAGMFVEDNWNMSVFCKCLGRMKPFPSNVILWFI